MRAPKGFIDISDPKVCQVGHPAPPWMASYADLMTELVCFFVILYALSAALNKDVQKAAADVKEMMDKGEMKGEVKIDKDGLKISIEEQGGAGFFGVGAAEPTPEIDDKLALLTPALAKLALSHEILVEGHCDERGTSEYNLALGQRRAAAAREHYMRLGVPGRSIATLSLGEEKPACLDHSEACRQLNRRASSKARFKEDGLTLKDRSLSP